MYANTVNNKSMRMVTINTVDVQSTALKTTFFHGRATTQGPKEAERPKIPRRRTRHMVIVKNLKRKQINRF